MSSDRSALAGRPIAGEPASARGSALTRATFRAAAFAMPVMISLQFFLVGVGVFADGGAWGLHRLNGALIAVPVLAVFAMTLAVDRLRRHRAAGARVLALYLMQFGWLALGEATGLGLVQALHALNAVILMGQSADLAGRVAGQGRA